MQQACVICVRVPRWQRAAEQQRGDGTCARPRCGGRCQPLATQRNARRHCAQTHMACVVTCTTHNTRYTHRRPACSVAHQQPTRHSSFVTFAAAQRAKGKQRARHIDAERRAPPREGARGEAPGLCWRCTVDSTGDVNVRATALGAGPPPPRLASAGTGVAPPLLLPPPTAPICTPRGPPLSGAAAAACSESLRVTPAPGGGAMSARGPPLVGKFAAAAAAADSAAAAAAAPPLVLSLARSPPASPLCSSRIQRGTGSCVVKRARAHGGVSDVAARNSHARSALQRAAAACLLANGALYVPLAV